MMNLHEHDSLNINHFITGKYASLYLKRVFFFDSNPPLGKLLLAAVAFLTGFDGEVKLGTVSQNKSSLNVKLGFLNLAS